MVPKKKTASKAKTSPKTKAKKQEESTEPTLEDIFGEVAAIWEFPEFVKHEKGKAWYATFTIIFLALLVYAYMSNNLLFAIILIVFVILYMSVEKKGPVNVRVALTADGILMNEKFIEYSNFRNFYIIYYPPEIKNLYFEPKSNFKQRVAIPLDDQDPVMIREFLLRFLDEDLKKEEWPASEGISRTLRL